MDAKKFKLNVGPFETAANIIDRIVFEQKLVENKDYKLAESKSQTEGIMTVKLHNHSLTTCF